jgi:hypothetical protein
MRLRRALPRKPDALGALVRRRSRPGDHRSDMVLAAVAATLAQLLDLATFARMVNEHGPESEANPFVAALLADHGLPFVVVTKITALALVVGVIAVLARRDGQPGHPRLALLIATAAVVAGLFGGWTNVSVIV